MSKKNFKPPKPEKGRFKAAALESVSTDQLRPVFAFHLMKSGRYCLGTCDREHRAEVADALYKRAQLTWARLKCEPRHGLGFEKIRREQIGAAIPPEVTEDVQHFIAFRYYGKRPLVGYRDGQVLHVLWIDHDFSLYDHGGS